MWVVIDAIYFRIQSVKHYINRLFVRNFNSCIWYADKYVESLDLNSQVQIRCPEYFLFQDSYKALHMLKKQ